MEVKEKESKHKHRLKGLFTKGKKVSVTEDNLDDFLHGTSDKLNFPAPTPTPQQLPKIDTQTARRWPTTAEINDLTLARARSTSPKRNRKGLVVKFSDENPEYGYLGSIYSL